jgi:hypothetical protein
MNDKTIARQIIKAQIASDAGKHEYDTGLTRNFTGIIKDLQDGYDKKLVHIINAINGICKSTDSMFRFAVYDSYDQNGYRSYITYFYWSIEGEKYQVSFHTPYNLGRKDLSKFVTHKRTVLWDRKIGGSFDSCLVLKKLFF